MYASLQIVHFRCSILGSHVARIRRPFAPVGRHRKVVCPGRSVLVRRRRPAAGCTWPPRRGDATRAGPLCRTRSGANLSRPRPVPVGGPTPVAAVFTGVAVWPARRRWGAHTPMPKPGWLAFGQEGASTGCARPQPHGRPDGVHLRVGPRRPPNRQPADGSDRTQSLNAQTSQRSRNRCRSPNSWPYNHHHVSPPATRRPCKCMHNRLWR